MVEIRRAFTPQEGDRWDAVIAQQIKRRIGRVMGRDPQKPPARAADEGLELAALAASAGEAFPASVVSRLREAAFAALDFLGAVTLPEGLPAAFNDSTGGVAPGGC